MVAGDLDGVVGVPVPGAVVVDLNRDLYRLAVGDGKVQHALGEAIDEKW